MTVQSSAQQTLYDALRDHLRAPPAPDPCLDPGLDDPDRLAAAEARQAAAAELRDLVGGASRLRVWWLQLPQDRRARRTGQGPAEARERESRWPAITVRVISAARGATQAGPVGLAEVRLQVDVWSRRKLADVAAAGDALRRALDGHRGALGRRRVQRIALEDEQDSHETDSARRMWRRRQDYRVWLAEG